MTQVPNGVGVFVRNHKSLLNRGCGRRSVYRSQIRWSGARELLASHSQVQLYACANGSDGIVQFAGRLLAVELDPTDASMAAVMRKLAAKDPARKFKEGLWNGRCKTLYVVELEHLAKPFSMTELVKLSDGAPISADYGYSYSLVRARIQPET